jgi:hypothetical protein
MSDVSAEVADPPSNPVPPQAEKAAPSSAPATVETAASEAASADTMSAETAPVAPAPVETATSESGTTASASAVSESSGATEIASTNEVGPTDDQHTWLSAFCGIDTRGADGAAVLSDATASAQGATPAKAATPDASPELGVLDKAKIALQVAGEVTGISGVVRTVEDKASAAVDTAEKMGSIVAEHPVDAAAGLAYGTVQGLAPGGFLAPSPDPNSQAFELGRGVGMMAGGVGAIAMGAGEEVVGIGADATGVGAVVGVPLNVMGAVVAASGATSAVAGTAVIASAMSMGGGGGSGVSTPKPEPRKADGQREKYKKALQKTGDTNYNEKVDGADERLKALDRAQNEYEATDTKDPAIIAKKNALDEAEAASEQSLQDLQKEFSARQGVLPGSSKFAEGKILYDQGKGLKSVLAWTKESGPLEYIQRKESLESLPEIAGRTNVRSGWWKGAVDHYQVYRKDGGLLDYSVIRSNIDGQELWSWVPTTH